MSVRAALTASQEIPPQAVAVKNASGVFSATLAKTKKGYRLSWRLTFRNLSGMATSAYIHKGKPGQHGAAFFHLCSPCTSGAHGGSYASPSEATFLSNGLMYVNIRTAKNPAGEIRGQIRAAG